MEELLPFEKIKREILVKKESGTDEKYGKDPWKRTVIELIDYGVINLNKPQGPTSHQISDYVKRILSLNIAGHSGTLDPNVTGVLPIALGRATRIVQALLPAGKEYICLMHVHKEIPEKEILNIIEQFKGKIQQTPPLRSAVRRQERTREIYYFNVLEIDGRGVLFKVGCQAGTYIRTICDSIGKKLNSGANMQQLVRTKAGPFTDKDWASLHDLKDAYEFWKEGDEKEIRKIIKPFEVAVEHLPKIWVFDSTVDSLCHGALLSNPGISKLNSEIKENDLVAVFSLKNELIGIGKALETTEKILKNEKGVAVKLETVFMLPDIYPKFKKTKV